MSSSKPASDSDVMRRWAPVIYFDDEEACFPSSTWWYLNRVEIVDAGKDGKPKTVHAPPLSVKKIRDHSDGTQTPSSKYQLQIPDDANAAETRAGQKLSKASGDEGKGKMLCTAPFYCHLLRIDDKTMDLQYFFFYPYDEVVGSFDSAVGSHEGDWEHVTVRVHWSKDYNPGKSGDPMLDGAFVSLFPSAHDGESDWCIHPEWETCGDGLSRPRVYCARGTHANYVSTDVSRWFSKDYVSETGPRWYGYHYVEAVAWSDNLSDDLCWLGFNGQWGATDAAIGHSPFGPAMKPEWKDSDWGKGGLQPVSMVPTPSPKPS